MSQSSPVTPHGSDLAAKPESPQVMRLPAFRLILNLIPVGSRGDAGPEDKAPQGLLFPAHGGRSGGDMGSAPSGKLQVVSLLYF